MAAALGMGENTRSMLMTRALAEMSRFAVDQGANPMTFLGLAGVGDLIVTCSSTLSRNFRVGQALGQGKGLDEAVAALGVPTLVMTYWNPVERYGVEKFAADLAGAGGAAHLAGVVASKTTLPVLGVPMPSKHLQGMDSLLSIVQMPKGIPVATFAIGDAGAANAGLFAVAMLALNDAGLAQKLKDFRVKQAESVKAAKLPELS